MAKGGVLKRATGLVKQKDAEKAIKAIEKEVRANENQWRIDLFEAETKRDNAVEALETLKDSTNTTAAEMLAAQRGADLAEADLKALQGIAEDRFEKKL
jgi:hypothetical protein